LEDKIPYMNIDNIMYGIWNLIAMFFSLPWNRYFTVSKYVFIVLDLVLIFLLVVLIKKAKTFAPPISKKYTQPSLIGLLKRKGLIQKYISMWNKIVEDSESAPPHSYTTAIVNADILVDELLKDAGFEGKDMGDRLGKLNGLRIRSLEGVWSAHRLRNKIVHTSGFEASKKAKEETLHVYEEFLKEIKILS